MKTPFSSESEKRREALQGHSSLNGIDFLEVVDGPGVPMASRQRFLVLYLINGRRGSVLDAEFTKESIRIEAERGTIPVTGLTLGIDDSIKDLWQVPPHLEPNTLTVKVAHPGDFSDHTLRVVDRLTGEPPEDFDPILSEIRFSFKVDCPSDADCRPQAIPAAEALPEPPIDYLAKDFASFRRLILDRMAVTVPEWQERNAADLGVTVVELLANAADHLSYYQDAVATEAYLGTARQRESVRRHARLLDYRMHDGCNARAWVRLEVTGAADGMQLPAGTRFLTRVSSRAALTRGRAPLPPPEAEGSNGGQPNDGGLQDE